jgi:uncharacterized membrane protein
MNEHIIKIFITGMFICVPIFILITFIFTIAFIFSPKLRGKLASKQIKATKYMVDETKDDLKSISDTMAEASKDSIKTTAKAIKEGF